MKQCTKCKQWLDESGFYKRKEVKNGLKVECKQCTKERRRIYHKEHQIEENEKARKRSSEYYHKNKERILLEQKEYRKTETYKKTHNKSNKKWRLKNPDYHKTYRKNNHQRCVEFEKIWRDNNKKHINLYKKEYRKSGRKKVVRDEWDKNNPDKVKMMYKRKKAKRRQMGFIELWDNPFPDDISVHFHHLNSNPGLIVPLPTSVHASLPPTPVPVHRQLANVWIEKLYCLDIGQLLSPTSF